MKKKLAFLLVLVVLFIIFLVVREVIFNKEGNTGRMKIVSSPSAGVFIDNTAVGKTPFEQKLKEGEYTIKLIPEGVSKDTVSWQGKVRVYKESLTYINRELGSSDVSSAGEVFTVSKMEKKPSSNNFGEVYIETDPPGAIVYLDNDEKGVSPLVLEEVTRGDHEVSVFLPGFFRRTHKINVDSAYRTNSTFKLAVDQTKKDISQLRQEKEDERKAAIEATKSATLGEASTQIVIQNTPTGFLRVREEPNTEATEVTRVEPGEKYALLEEGDGWYKIKVDDSEGWVSSDYAVKEEAAKASEEDS